MATNKNNDKNIPCETEACYETLASQEEIYLEETEEEVRAILTSDDQSPSQTTAIEWRNKIEGLELDWEVEKNSMTNAGDDPSMATNLQEQLDHAAEELITGDSDDPPLSEETVVEMIRVTHVRKTYRSVS